MYETIKHKQNKKVWIIFQNLEAKLFSKRNLNYLIIPKVSYLLINLQFIY